MMTLTVLFLFQAQAFQAIPYYDPQGRLPTTYQEYASAQIDAPFQARVAGSETRLNPRTLEPRNPVASGSYSRLVVVLVNSSLYPAIQTELATYAADLSAEGFSSKVITTSGGRAQNLRQILIAHRDSGLVGTLMVGDLPVAWWSDGSYGEDFPIDLFFTDLTGSFSDANADGMYDGYSGSGPQIWCGRIYASRLTYDGEEHLVKSYFQRNHQYRTGQLPIAHRGLVCNNAFSGDDHDMLELYPGQVSTYNGGVITAYFYKNQLRQGYEFVHLVSHSSPWVNTFFFDGGVAGGGSVFNFELPALQPNAAFYFLNACMTGRFTERDNLGNWYLFAQPWAQAVIASSQLMYSVDDLSEIYGPLRRDSCLGDGFTKWHRSNWSWFMGTLVLGDPSLKISHISPQVARVAPRVHQTATPQDWTQYVIDTTNYVSGRPLVACSQGRIRIIFDSGRIVRSDNFLTSFNGTSFTRPESIAWHDYYDLFSATCTDALGRLWVVWQSFRDYDQGYDHFQLFGSYYYNGTWSGALRVGAQAGYHDVQPAIASGTDNVVWCAFKSWRNGQGDIWVSNETNGGSWSAPVRLTTDSLDQIDPCVVVDHANRPWVFWQSQVNGRFRIQGRTYNGTWQPAFDLDTLGNAGPPRATVDGDGNIWVIWSGSQAGANHIYYACRADSVWQPVQAITSGPANDYLPAVTTDPAGTVWACWQSGSAGAWSINTSRYAGGWTVPDPVTDSASNNYDPTICADTSGNIWVAWASDRRGYWNIYAAELPAEPSGVATQPGLNRTWFDVKPNPFARAVSFFGPEHFSVDIFTFDGRLVTRLSSQTGRVNWTPGQLAHGVYIAYVVGNGVRATAKLVHTD